MQNKARIVSRRRRGESFTGRAPIAVRGECESGVGQMRLLVRQPAVLDVEVGVEERGALRPRKLGWALIHSLGFISRA